MLNLHSVGRTGRKQIEIELNRNSRLMNEYELYIVHRDVTPFLIDKLSE